MRDLASMDWKTSTPYSEQLTDLISHVSWNAKCIMMTSSNGNIFRLTGPLSVENSPVASEFSTQRPVTRSFDIFCDLCLNKMFSKQPWGWWFETPSRPSWRHCNGVNEESAVLYFCEVLTWNWVTIEYHFWCIPFSPWIASISYKSALVCVWNYFSQLTLTEISNHWQATSTVVLSFCHLPWRVDSFNNSFSRVRGFTRSCAMCLLDRVWINAFPRRTSCLISQRCCVSTLVVCYAKCTKQ